MNKSKYFLLIGVVLLLPIFAYMCRFGFGIWESHSDWASMGSALSGIYSPIIALLGLILVYKQITIQQILTKHTLDWDFFNNCKDNINVNLNRIELILYKDRSNPSLIVDQLNKLNTMDESEVLMKDQKLIEFAENNSDLLNHWGAMYPSLIGLRSVNSSSYDAQLNMLKLNIISALQPGICVALDKVYWVSGAAELEQLEYWQHNSVKRYK